MRIANAAARYAKNVISAISGREYRGAFSHARSESIINILGTTSASGARVSEHTALTESAVNSCVSILSDMIGIMPCKLYRRTESGREEMRDHPASRLVNITPDGHMTSYEFRRIIQAGVGLGGNGYAHVERDGLGNPVAMRWLQPSKISMQRIQSTGDIVYLVSGDNKPRTRRDILHVFGLSTDGLFGMSPVRMMREDIGLALTQRDTAANTYRNGARFPGYLSVPGSLTDDARKRLREDWQNVQEGAENSGRTPILSGGLEYKIAQGMTLADAEFLASRSFGVEVVARYYRIPLFLLQSTQKATTWGSGLEQMNLGFLQYSLNPWLVNWEQSLALTLLTDDEINQGYYFKFNRRALLQASLDAQAAFLRQMRDCAIYSPNDCRRYLEENDIPGDIGDDYQLPFNGSGGSLAPKPQQPPGSKSTPEENNNE